jgi:putative exosortase-associated protein (TIGR04073 family)
MKKGIAILIIAGVVFLSALPAYAGNPVEKLGRGLANVGTSPLEIPKTMGQVQEEKGIFAGWTLGVLQGLVNTVKRAGVGIYEVVTFPIPFPRDYEPILEDPEFFLQKKPLGRIK